MMATQKKQYEAFDPDLVESKGLNLTTMQGKKGFWQNKKNRM